jgi:hypothetical protein
MANVYEITEVHTVKPYGAMHEHIERVRLRGRRASLSKEVVIADLRNPWGDRYYTNAKGIRAKVIAVTCPHCRDRDYITTEPDWTVENNLLSLPRF